MYLGDGNAASPLGPGRCCDRCDVHIVIPARSRLMDQMGLEELRALAARWRETLQ
jgi:hypothetical protein